MSRAPCEAKSPRCSHFVSNVELGKRLRRIKLRHRYGCGPATVDLELADTSTWPIKINASMIVQVLT